MADLNAIALTTIKGAATSLADYEGKVLLVVNVASKCGLTPQYEGLEKLHERFHDRGFSVLGFPANDFGAQEPGTEEEIQSFCSTQYGVTFPMFSKIEVTGPNRHPLYNELIAQQPAATLMEGSGFKEKLLKYGIKPASDSDVFWNFEKFLVDRHGKAVARFAPDTPPDDELIIKAIEARL
ncbi:MAG: glutathione peroxidase [Hydrocarboniphaga sp.]|uniref:glutathione peroxidase n=1 Tax=Hydrocarboniphaga sp. TaxID=2033016 RepID=UPI00260DD12B|nr:redoxin domain-containing protein [Hydrocarboniphaga sp.]MDB5968775.1 glutathione peroxidase [Hydrocarboniphaga sp.]